MQANGSVEILSCDWAVYRWWPCHDQSSALFAGESGTQQTPGHPHGGGGGARMICYSIYCTFLVAARMICYSIYCIFLVASSYQSNFDGGPAVVDASLIPVLSGCRAGRGGWAWVESISVAFCLLPDA